MKIYAAAAHCGQSLRLASAPEQSSTVVHSCSVLGAKLDLVTHCIRRLKQPFDTALTKHAKHDIFCIWQ